MIHSNAITEFIRLVKQPGELFECRAFPFNARGVFSGWFTPETTGILAAKLTGIGDCEGVFFTPNRLRESACDGPKNLLARVSRRMRTTSDNDVSERIFLMVDVDPVRAPGCEKLSATTAEKGSAWQVAIRVKSELRSVFPAPLVVDSGNGYHLYYRLATTEPGGAIVDDLNDPITRFLRILAAKFDNEYAEIDIRVRNASRVMKLPGTMARKGPHSDERPHRMAKLIEVPDGWATC